MDLNVPKQTKLTIYCAMPQLFYNPLGIRLFLTFNVTGIVRNGRKYSVNAPKWQTNLNLAF